MSFLALSSEAGNIMFDKLYNEVDNNSQKLLTFMQKNVKLSIQGLIEDIENNSVGISNGLKEILNYYKEFC